MGILADNKKLHGKKVEVILKDGEKMRGLWGEYFYADELDEEEREKMGLPICDGMLLYGDEKYGDVDIEEYEIKSIREF